MTGRWLRLFWRVARYEVVVLYGEDFGGKYDWLGMFVTRAGAERAMREARPNPSAEKPQTAIMLGLPDRDYAYEAKAILLTRDLA